MPAPTPPIEITVNGQPRQLRLSPDTAVLTVLRQDLGLLGTRVGCTEGHCGACTVLLDGRPVQSCNLPLWSVAGHSIRTIEGVAANGTPGFVQHAFLEEQAGQCGYCINGIMMTVTGLLEQTPPATRHEILRHLDERHLCRCGAQPRILRAVDRAIAMAAALRQEVKS
jgi:aerobic-type carbon monoxide dehydrogenase small subunit (CoxS/CutS family)